MIRELKRTLVFQTIEELEGFLNAWRPITEENSIVVDDKKRGSIFHTYTVRLYREMEGAVGNDPTSEASKASSLASERPVTSEWCPTCNGSGLAFDTRYDWGAGHVCPSCNGRCRFIAEKK